jgi:hypothetical protein
MKEMNKSIPEKTWVSTFTPVKQERGTTETIQQHILLMQTAYSECYASLTQLVPARSCLDVRLN